MCCHVNVKTGTRAAGQSAAAGTRRSGRREQGPRNCARPPARRRGAAARASGGPRSAVHVNSNLGAGLVGRAPSRPASRRSVGRGRRDPLRRGVRQDRPVHDGGYRPRPRGGRARSGGAAPGRGRPAPAAGGHRKARLSPRAALSAPGGSEAFIAALDEQAPTWRRTGTRPNDIDRALDAAERGGPCHGPAGARTPDLRRPGPAGRTAGEGAGRYDRSTM